MTLKITRTGPGSPPVLALDGRLTSDEVAESRRVVDEVGEPVVLLLGGLQFADRPGVRALQELKAQGTKLTGASPYIALLIGERQHDAAN